MALLMDQFCATGTMGLSGNLTAGEILEQIVHADRILAQEWEDLKREHEESKKTTDSSLPKVDLVRNVVFMGMGEPLDNYKNVIEACRALIDKKRWNLAQGRVTVSTVGIVSKIRKLTVDLPEISLALSLHAPNQKMRTAIVPTATRYPIEELIEALDGHMMANHKKRKYGKNTTASTTISDNYTTEERMKASSRRRAMIEYVMLEGETSTIAAAHELGKLCEGRQLVVNLIPYNQTDVKDTLRCPSDERLDEFKRIVSSYGVFCTIRRTMGADIDSACGQLITSVEHSNEKNQNKNLNESVVDTKSVPDIEDLTRSQFSGISSTKSISTVKRMSLPTTYPKIIHNCTDNIEEDSKCIKLTNEETVKHSHDYERWIYPLAIATTVSATFFVISTALLIKSRHNKR